jgi:hypothetical protein
MQKYFAGKVLWLASGLINYYFRLAEIAVTTIASNEK